jgi:glutamyl-tRNA reductase
MVLGEDQILAQVKSALAAAHAAGSVGSILNSLFQHSLAAGKRVRTETAINEGSFSIGSAAVELARSVFGQSLSGHKALVLGAGNMSELTAKHLQSHGVASVIVANRTFDRALSLAAALGDGAEAKLFDQLPVLLETSDIVICSTSAPHVVVSKTLLAEVMKKRANRPLFLIDIAAPRDVEPTAREIPEVYLFNIDDLKEVVAKSSEARLQETEKAQRIVDENAKQFLEWWSAAEAAPLVVAVRQKIDSIMLGETARLRTKMSGASEREFREVEKAMQSFAGKISQLATMAIRIRDRTNRFFVTACSQLPLR